MNTRDIRPLIGKEVLFRLKTDTAHFKCSIFKRLSPNEKFVEITSDSENHICLGWIEVDNVLLEDVLTVDSPEPSKVEYEYWYCKKPPLGITPKWLYDEQRLKSLYDAIKRYMDAGLLPNQEWMQEMYQLSKDVENRETKFYGK
jgi:hypothetical protein